jgi:hypothetical protein
MVMPSKSKKQQDFMAAVANNPKFAKKAGVPQSVGKDYEKADKMKGMKKYQAGGMSQGYNARLDDSMGAKNGKKEKVALCLLVWLTDVLVLITERCLNKLHQTKT